MSPLHVVVATPLDETRAALEGALRAQGFGILTEIDVAATLRAKLGVEHEPHRILGVCKPAHAKRALDVDRDVATLLPCTVTLRAVDAGTEIIVLDPEAAFSLAAPTTRAALAPLAAEAKAELQAALAQLTA